MGVGETGVGETGIFRVLYPLAAHFYIVKLGCTGLYIFFSYFCSKTEIVGAAPVAKWVRSLFFSALNHSIISPLCLM